jgi:hypothetical protein
MPKKTLLDGAPNGTEGSKLESYVERYRAFGKASAEAIIKQAETLLEASKELHTTETPASRSAGVDGQLVRSPAATSAGLG